MWADEMIPTEGCHYDQTGHFRYLIHRRREGVVRRASVFTSITFSCPLETSQLCLDLDPRLEKVLLESLNS